MDVDDCGHETILLTVAGTGLRWLYRLTSALAIDVARDGTCGRDGRLMRNQIRRKGNTMADTQHDHTPPPADTEFEAADPLADTGVEFEADDTVAADDTVETSKPVNAAAQLLKDGAARLGKEATDRARGYVDDGKARAGGALDELARMMTEAAGTVDEKLGEHYGHYARTAADRVSGFSEGLKAKELDDLIDDARDFVQKSPAIAIGTAAALGFVLVRLIQSGLAVDRDEA